MRAMKACKTYSMGMCGVVACVKRNTLQWLGHTERMKSDDFMKKNVYEQDKGSKYEIGHKMEK